MPTCIVFDPGQSLREKILHIADDRRIILLFLAPIILAAGIYLTGCRSGIAVLVLSVLFFAQMSVYLRVNFSARRHLRLLFILATLLAVFIGVQSTLDKFLTGNYIKEISRIDYWANALAMFRDFPLFGTGLGTFKYAYFLYGRETGFVNHAHNEYVESLADMGALASVAFFALLADPVFFPAAHVDRPPPPRGQAHGAGRTHGAVCGFLPFVLRFFSARAGQCLPVYRPLRPGLETGHPPPRFQR